MKNSGYITVFLFFLAVYILFSNQRVTTSMDVDVVRYASEYAETGSYGSEIKLSAGVSYSPKTGLFYPQEGVGIVVPLTLFMHLSDSLTPDSQFILYSFNQIFSALSVMMMFLVFSLYLDRKKALFYTLIFGLGTPIFVHSKYFLPEPVTLLAITSALYFILKFKKENKLSLIFFSGLSAGYTLLSRPDAPIFAGLFFVLAVYLIFEANKCLFIRFAAFFVLGFSVFTMIFLISNYQRYGSFFETGYTLDRSEVIASLEKDMPVTYEKAAAAYQNDQNSKETSMLVQQFQSQQKFLEDQKKTAGELGNVNTALSTNGAVNFIHGIYLILFSPNRSIFLLSPFLLIVLFGIGTCFRKHRIEFIIAASIFLGYLVLYALRAPLSYAGSAAWGIRYMLPVYPILFLSIIFYERSEISKNKTLNYIFYSLCAVSVLFQIIGSSVNYQSVQMPLEYKSKQMYGDKDMTWAHESRKSMMSDFSSSLLLNNLRIMSGSLTLEQKAYGVETGPNDWFFWHVIKGEGRLVQGKEHLLGTYRLILFMMLLCVAGSLIYVYKCMHLNIKK